MRIPATCLIVAILAALPAPALPADAGLRRLPIPVDAIRAEDGRCFIATLDFGEQGDNDPANSSGLVLLEDGVPLGPAHASHADIRVEGGGRYSHWTRTMLYFSSSDGSDPRTNERLYEVASTNPLSLLPGLPEIPSVPREHVQVVTEPGQDWVVPMGGTLDMENTRIVSTSTCRVGFQPNVELVIANTGDTPVVNPRLVVNGRGDWHDFAGLLAEWTRGARDDREKAMLLWENMRRHTYHLEPLFEHDIQPRSGRLFNIFGFSLCDDAGAAANALFLSAGLDGSECRAMDGHVQAEAMVDGRLQFLDVDMDCFYLDRENERPVGGDELARDHDLVRRELNYGPVAGSYRPSDELAALFGADDTRFTSDVRGHTMDYTLRPGERVVFRWDHIGKYAAQDSAHAHRPPYFGNSRFEYSPRLRAAVLAADAISSGGWQDDPDGPGLRAVAAGAHVEYGVAVPWLVCGGTLTLAIDRGDVTARCAVEIATGQDPGAAWRTVWESDGPGKVHAVVPLDASLAVRSDPPEFGYRVRVSVSASGPVLEELALVTDIMAAPLSLPRLQVGDNKVAWTDESPGPRHITVTQRWLETDAVPLLPPPPAPLLPQPGAAVAADRIEYAWPEVPGARRYRLQVSLRPDFAWPYRPGLDVAIPTPAWTVPFDGIYSPGVTYYWRVRCMGERGAWGPWSDTWTFTWDGPRVPVDVRGAAKDGRVTLHWKPNPRGPRPVAYEVYGSGIRGFTVSREEQAEYGLGPLPPNLLARTSGTSLEVVAPEFEGAAASEVFYRVVAIDAAGTRSGPSDYAELPHPYFFSVPVTTAATGEHYEYRLRSLASMGDLQFRTLPDGSQDRSFSAGDHQRFRLVSAPAWLAVDEESGLVSGTPPAAGRYHVAAEASNRFGGRARHEWMVEVAPEPGIPVTGRDATPAGTDGLPVRQ